MPTELCRDVAFEACQRGATANPHELWALLETVDDLHPRLVVDVGSGESVWWAWWSLGSRVVGVPGPGATGGGFRTADLPSTVTAVDGDHRDRATALRVSDQLAGNKADVVVLAAARTELDARADWAVYAPLARPGGLVVVYGIAHPELPGVAAFWHGLCDDDARELVASELPMGYGLMMIHDTEGSRRHG
jgi:cephalosporin hydroxylase